MPDCLEIYKVLDNEIVSEIYEMIANIEEPRWTKRNELNPYRGINGADCNYDFCGHSQMSKDMKEKLKGIAPKYPNFTLAEIAINRYKIGDYIGKHKDRHFYRRNLVISLQENGDGLLLDDENMFIEDKIGQGVLFEGIGPTHSVPPVSNLRYSLIYLYE